jgi:hypothetical protein
MFTFVSCMFIHRIYWIRAVSLGDVFRGLFLAVLIPVWLVVSGNYTAVQAITGGLVGFGLAVFMSQAIYLILIDRIDALVELPLLRRMGYKNTLRVYQRWDMAHVESGSAANELMSSIDEESLQNAGVLTYPIKVSKRISERVRSYHRVGDEMTVPSPAIQSSPVRTLLGSAAEITSRAFLGHSIFENNSSGSDR